MNVVIYSRVSSQSARQSTERQVVDLERFAAGRGYEVTAVFEEKISGRKANIERPVLSRCLEYCTDPQNRVDMRLNSGRELYIQKGGRLGRKPGTRKTAGQKKEEYREAIALLKKGYSIRNVAKLTGKAVSTIQIIKKEFIDK